MELANSKRVRRRAGAEGGVADAGMGTEPMRESIQATICLRSAGEGWRTGAGGIVRVASCSATSSQRLNWGSIGAEMSCSMSNPATLVLAPWQPVQYWRRSSGGVAADAAAHPRRTASASLTRKVYLFRVGSMPAIWA